MKKELIPRNPELADFYHFVTESLPEGLPGKENEYLVKVGGSQLSAIIFEPEEGLVKIGLFTEGGKYSRKTLELNEQGDVTEDTRGTTPEKDYTENEPNFRSLSNEEIMASVVQQIKNYKRPKTN